MCSDFVKPGSNFFIFFHNHVVSFINSFVYLKCIYQDYLLGFVLHELSPLLRSGVNEFLLCQFAKLTAVGSMISCIYILIRLNCSMDALLKEEILVLSYLFSCCA